MPKITTRKQALSPSQKYQYEGTGTFGVDGTYEWVLGTGWYYQPVPKALHRYRVVIFTLVPDGTTNRYLRSLRYPFVLPTGTLDSYMSYFERKVFPSQSELLCSWDGKGAQRVRLEVVGSNPSQREYFAWILKG